jgi:hypothetical protein
VHTLRSSPKLANKSLYAHAFDGVKNEEAAQHALVKTEVSGLEIAASELERICTSRGTKEDALTP